MNHVLFLWPLCWLVSTNVDHCPSFDQPLYFLTARMVPAAVHEVTIVKSQNLSEFGTSWRLSTYLECRRGTVQWSLWT